MIRFAWLQSRTQTAVAFGALAMIAVALALTGPNLAHLYSTLIAPCIGDGTCSPSTIELFQRNHRLLRVWLNIGITVIPGLIGIFWGAPIVARELEAGTFRLAWTQGVSRTRWIAIKLCVTLLSSMAVAGLLSFMITWWAHPLDRVRGDVFSTFDQRDIVPIGYAAFGFVLGMTVGVIIRRTLPAMATFVVVFTAARVAMSNGCDLSSSPRCTLSPSWTPSQQASVVRATGRRTCIPKARTSRTRGSIRSMWSTMPVRR